MVKQTDDDKTLLLLFQDYIDKEMKSHNFNNMKLPITLDPHKYGEVRVSNIIDGDSLIVKYIVINGNKTYEIDICDGGMVNKVKMLGSINLSLVDRRINNDSSDSFVRTIKKSTIYFLDGEVILRKKELPVKAFRKLQKESKIDNELITLDIETKLINNKVTPYLINSYDGISRRDFI